MRPFLCLFCAGATFVGAELLNARESEGARVNFVLLNGAWEFVQGEGNEGAETSAPRRRRASWCCAGIASQMVLRRFSTGGKWAKTNRRVPTK